MAKILVIEDHPGVRAAIREFLETCRHDVIEASEGDEGLRKFKSDPADLVVLDLYMPEKEGLETIRALRAAAPRLPIIAISGGGKVGDTSILSVASALGADRAFKKPFDWSEFLRTVDDLVQQSGRPAP